MKKWFSNFKYFSLLILALIFVSCGKSDMAVGTSFHQNNYNPILTQTAVRDYGCGCVLTPRGATLEDFKEGRALNYYFLPGEMACVDIENTDNLDFVNPGKYVAVCGVPDWEMYKLETVDDFNNYYQERFGDFKDSETLIGNWYLMRSRDYDYFECGNSEPGKKDINNINDGKIYCNRKGGCFKADEGRTMPDGWFIEVDNYEEIDENQYIKTGDQFGYKFTKGYKTNLNQCNLILNQEEIEEKTNLPLDTWLQCFDRVNDEINKTLKKARPTRGEADVINHGE